MTKGVQLRILHTNLLDCIYRDAEQGVPNSRGIHLFNSEVYIIPSMYPKQFFLHAHPQCRLHRVALLIIEIVEAL